MRLLFLVFSLSAFGFSVLSQTNQAEELGLVQWNRDLDKAKELSLGQDKPILILFQEIPGCSICRNYGQDVLSNPLLVEAIEDQFIPLVIHNNKGGKDKMILEKFSEPSWNNPVVRIINTDEEMLAPRLSGNYSARGLVNTMKQALEKEKKELPEYLSLLHEELNQIAKSSEAYYEMYCFWSGEVHLGLADGVLSTESGFMNGSEVVKVIFDPSIISKNELDAHGKSKNISPIEKGNYKKSENDTHYQIMNSIFKFLPMSEIQRTKINSALGQGSDAKKFLSPAQIKWLTEIENSSDTHPILFHKNLQVAWKLKTK